MTARSRRITTGPTELGILGDEYNESPWREGSTTHRPTAPFPPQGLTGIILVTRHLELSAIFELDQLSTGFDFHEKKKSCLFGVDRCSNAVVSLLPCHYTMEERWRRLFFPKLHVHIKDNNNLPRKFRWFLFSFSNKSPDLNFALYVLYIYSYCMKPVCDTNSEPGLSVVPLCNYPH